MAKRWTDGVNVYCTGCGSKNCPICCHLQPEPPPSNTPPQSAEPANNSPALSGSQFDWLAGKIRERAIELSLEYHAKGFPLAGGTALEVADKIIALIKQASQSDGTSGEPTAG